MLTNHRIVTAVPTRTWQPRCLSKCAPSTAPSVAALPALNRPRRRRASARAAAHSLSFSGCAASSCAAPTPAPASANLQAGGIHCGITGPGGAALSKISRGAIAGKMFMHQTRAAILGCAPNWCARDRFFTGSTLVSCKLAAGLKRRSRHRTCIAKDRRGSAR